MSHTPIARILADGQPGQTAAVAGWVRTRRDSKQGLTFVEVNDGSCLSNLQLIIDADVAESLAGPMADVSTGASLTASGTLRESPGKGQRVELGVQSLEVVGPADPETYPLQKKRHSFEFLREIAHLRPRSNTFGCIARVRNAATFAVHRFFQDRGFLNVHTPIITTSDCEGAGEMFQVTTIDLEKLSELPPRPLDYRFDFFARRASLTVSGQLEAEIFATSVGPCYTFGPTFRAENSNTTRHLAEFWMIEPEVPFLDLAGNMSLAEDFVKAVIAEVLERCPEDMQFFDQRIDKGLLDRLRGIVAAEFARVSYADAVELLTGSGQTFEYPVEWGSNLQAEHERWLTEEHFGVPVIVHDYPASIKPFYMKVGPDAGERTTVGAMDVLVPGIGELIGGSQREDRLEVLEARMKEAGQDPAETDWYLDLRRYGTVPHSGFGLGFERLMLLLTGMQNIRDVIPFPRTPRNASF